MNSQDHLTLISNLLLALPMLIFLPGFFLTRTFLKTPTDASLTEKIFLRVILSIPLVSIAGMIIAGFNIFSNIRITFAVVLVSFFIFVFGKSKFKRSKLSFSFETNWQDSFVVLLAMISLFLFLRPSEDIGSVFSMGAHIARSGSFDLSVLSSDLRTFLLNSPLTSIWIAISNSFFGLHLSILTVPVFGMFSVLACFFLAKRLFGMIAAIAASLLLVTNFTQIWFCRLSEGFILAQFFILSGLYLARLYFIERNKGFLIMSLLSLALSSLAQIETVGFLTFFCIVFVLATIFTKNADRRLPDLAKRLLIFGALACSIFMLKAPPHLFWMIMPCLWITALAGAVLFFWKEAKTHDLIFLLSFIFYPTIYIQTCPGSGTYMMNLSGYLHLVLPSIYLLNGYCFQYFSNISKRTLVFALIAITSLSALPIYIHRDLILQRDFEGFLKFFDSFKKSFLQNDLLFSTDEELISFFWKIYGLKIYDIHPEYMDRAFREEIIRWLKDGGKAFVLSRQDAPSMEGFILKIESVERLRTRALEQTLHPPENRILREILIKVYEAIPEETSPE